MPIVDPRTGEPLAADTPASDAGSAASGADPMPEVIVDADAGNIQQLLELSMQVPVLLDCWAPWCEPCKNLMPVLEKLAREYRGAFILAKLNIDENQEIAAQLGVRSVPDVKLISQGGLVDHFQGALPEKQVREWLGLYFPAPEDAPASPEEQAAEALAAGGAATARALLDNLPPEERDAAPARGVRASIEFGEEAPDAEALAALGERDDSEAQYLRALRNVADGHYEAGLDALLALMKSDRAWSDDAARRTLLRVFDVLGAEHPLTVSYRRKLFAMLY